jgi:hypothetical protein
VWYHSTKSAQIQHEVYKISMCVHTRKHIMVGNKPMHLILMNHYNTSNSEANKWN